LEALAGVEALAVVVVLAVVEALVVVEALAVVEPIADNLPRWSRVSTPEEVALSPPEAVPGVRLMVGLTGGAIPSSAWLSTPSPFASRAAKLALISDRQKVTVLE
jgi:hypothetical protein